MLKFSIVSIVSKYVILKKSVKLVNTYLCLFRFSSFRLELLKVLKVN